jgi:hypothetical protein
VVFSLALLVHDVEEAAKCLQESGLSRVEMNREDRMNPRLDEDGHLPRFEGPKPSDPWPSSAFQVIDPNYNTYGLDDSWRIELQPASF